MIPGAANGFLVLRDLLVDTLVLDGVELPDPKATQDPQYRGSFRGYFDVPPGAHTVVARVAGKEHATTVVVLPGWATVKRFDGGSDGWGDDDAGTEQEYRHLALSGSMQEAGALRPWPVPAPAAAPAKTRLFGGADFAWLRATFAESRGAPADSMAVQRYVDALRWHYILDSEMGVQAAYFGRFGRELADHVRARPELLGTAAATYLDYFAVDLVDADQPETIEAGGELAKALEQARRLAPPAPVAAVRSPARRETPKGKSPLFVVVLAAAVIMAVVMMARRSSTPPSPPVPAAPALAPLPRGAATATDYPSAKKQMSLFLYEAGVAHEDALVEQGTLLEKAVTADDCVAARAPFDRIKETKVDLTTHTALVLSQIRMLTTVAAYCNTWAAEIGRASCRERVLASV